MLTLAKGWLVKLNQAQGTLEIETYASFIRALEARITTSGNFKIHTFTGDGCFVVSKVVTLVTQKMLIIW